MAMVKREMMNIEDDLETEIGRAFRTSVQRFMALGETRYEAETRAIDIITERLMVLMGQAEV